MPRVLEQWVSGSDQPIRIFGLCSSLAEANEAFNKLDNPNDCSGIIRTHVKLGQAETALQLYRRMFFSGGQISKYIYIGVLQACIATLGLNEGRCIHEQIINNRLQYDGFVGNILAGLYGKCGSLKEACNAFTNLLDRDAVSWGTMISIYAHHGEGNLALECFEEMQQQGLRPNRITFLSILKACCTVMTVEVGRYIHEQAVKSEFCSDISIRNALVDMYAKCGSLEEAHKVFNNLENRNVISWGAMIAGYTQYGKGLPALECFQKMQQEGIKPNEVIFSSMIKACTSIGAIDQGERIHQQVIESGLQNNVFVGNALVDMYAKCGDLRAAREVFDNLLSKDVISWGAMISGYAQYGEGPLALECFQKMQQTGVKPNRVIFLSILKACSTMVDMEQGRDVHKQIIDNGLQFDPSLGNALVDMYAKCGNLVKARQIFDTLTNRNVVSWGAMIAGYAQHNEGLLALECFKDLKSEGIKVNEVVFSSILKACGSIGAIEQGKDIHQQVIESGLQDDVFVGNAVIDMYAKCGNMEEANSIFRKFSNRDAVSWGSMIAGYVQCGNATLALQCLNDMEQEAIKPNVVTYSIILSLCSHAGLVEEGCKYFISMVEKHAVWPITSHYICMVDLLARAGYLNEAKSLLQTIEPDVIGWTSLLTACRRYGNVKLGKQCFDQIVLLDAQYTAGYILMSNIYSDSRMWENAAQLEQLRQRMGAWKKPAKAWIEVDNQVHEFNVGSKSHPRNTEIYGMLEKLTKQMKGGGYTPKVDLVLGRSSADEKEDALCGHCEKLAIAFGFISVLPGSAIRVAKNLRMCMDCHDSTRIISKIERREIVVRDT